MAKSDVLSFCVAFSLRFWSLLIADRALALVQLLALLVFIVCLVLPTSWWSSIPAQVSALAILSNCVWILRTASVRTISLYGLPPFRQDESGGFSDASRSEKHAAARIGAVLHLSPRDTRPLHEVAESKIWAGLAYTDDAVAWKSEADVQRFVVEVIEELIRMAGLHFICHMEVTVLGMWPDIGLIIRRERLANGGLGASRPVGVIEVKQPLVGILDDPRFLGQVLDYLRILRHQFGVIDAFAIGSTYSQWRVYRLPEHDVVCGPNRLVEAGATLDGFSDVHVLCRTLCCALRCMNEAAMQPEDARFPVSLDPSRAYMQVDVASWRWATRKAKALNFNSMPTSSSLLLLRDLGRGLHGHAWLACSDAGLVCVVKIALSPSTQAAAAQVHAQDTLEEELRAWKIVNPHAAAALGTIMSRRALRMAYAKPVARGECDARVAAAVANMAAKGVWHRDLSWRHVGMFDAQITFLDFGSCVLGNGDIRAAQAAMLQDLGL
jgi:hypothetical protein